MKMQYCFGILVLISSAKLCEALGQCPPLTYSVYGHYLSGHVISTKIVYSLSECVIMCFNEFGCRSLNFHLKYKSCDLNGADKHTHPEDYGPKKGSVYMDNSEKHKKNGFKSCAEILQEWPQAESGYYWVKIGDRDAQVYCDMKSHGGGWTLVVSISSKNNDHLRRAANNCFNSALCVRFDDMNIASRKLSDGDIHKLAQTEGTFRIDVLRPHLTYAVFYQIPSGAEHFDSKCYNGRCPRIIVSYSYPYVWETNGCTSIDVGYHIHPGCHYVFDGYDDTECNKRWRSSGISSERRALYGYPCNGYGIYRSNEGMLFVK